MIYESEKFVNFQPKSVTLQNELADKHYVNICILCNVFHNFLRVLNILLTKNTYISYFTCMFNIFGN